MSKKPRKKANRTVVTVSYPTALAKKVTEFAAQLNTSMSLATCKLVEIAFTTKRPQKAKPIESRAVECLNCGYKWNTKAVRVRCSKCKKTRMKG